MDDKQNKIKNIYLYSLVYGIIQMSERIPIIFTTVLHSMRGAYDILILSLGVLFIRHVIIHRYSDNIIIFFLFLLTHFEIL